MRVLEKKGAQITTFSGATSLDTTQDTKDNRAVRHGRCCCHQGLFMTNPVEQRVAVQASIVNGLGSVPANNSLGYVKLEQNLPWLCV